MAFPCRSPRIIDENTSVLFVFCDITLQSIMCDAPSVLESSCPDKGVFFSLSFVLDNSEANIGQMFFCNDTLLTAKAQVIVTTFVCNRHLMARIVGVSTVTQKNLLFILHRLIDFDATLAPQIVELSTNHSRDCNIHDTASDT